MKHLLIVLLAALTLMAAGCSDDDNPSGPGGTPPVVGMSVTTWNTSGQYWNTQLNATSTTDFVGYSFEAREAVTSGVQKPTATGWDFAFRRYVPKLNGGASTTNGGDVVGADLGVVDFASVTIADTAGATWQADEIDYQINNWFDYNPVTHALTANRNVYSLIDAEADNYVKFQIDSMVGAGMPPNMGTVYMTYFYQATANSRDLSGATVQVAIPVGSNKTYFDFSSGSVVTPANPMSSTGWDIFFYNYDLGQNSGINGSGNCGAYNAYLDLVNEMGTDPWNIDAFTSQPFGPTMDRDDASSAMTDWYAYADGRLTSHYHVYLLKTAGKVYKLAINTYYGDASGSPTPAWLDFNWSEL